MSDADASRPHPPRPAIWNVLRRGVGRLAFGGLCLAFIALMCAGYWVAYLDLAGPHCDSHPMAPADTCSVLTSRGLRSMRTIEKLNPASSSPAVLTAPAKWHAAQDNIHQGVYSPAGMQEFHRPTGYFMLGFALLISLILGSWTYKAIRARARSSTAAKHR